MSEKGTQAKAIEHYEAALMCLYPVRGDAWEHWNEARKLLVNRDISTDISEVEEEPVADSATTDLIFKRLTNMEVDQLLSSGLSTHEIICAVENRLALKNDAKYF